MKKLYISIIVILSIMLFQNIVFQIKYYEMHNRLLNQEQRFIERLDNLAIKIEKLYE